MGIEIPRIEYSSELNLRRYENSVYNKEQQFRISGENFDYSVKGVRIVSQPFWRNENLTPTSQYIQMNSRKVKN